MKRLFSAVSLVFLVCLSSCGTPARITVHEAGQIDEAIKAEKVILVFDVDSRHGRYFQEYFLDTFTRLSQDTSKRLSIMTGYEYAGSPYCQADTPELSDDILFVMVKVDNCEKGDYDTRTVTYVMTIQYQGQEPLFMEEIALGFANPYLETGNWRGHELAEVIYEELNKRNIL